MSSQRAITFAAPSFLPPLASWLLFPAPAPSSSHGGLPNLPLITYQVRSFTIHMFLRKTSHPIDDLRLGQPVVQVQLQLLLAEQLMVWNDQREAGKEEKGPLSEWIRN